MALSKKNRLIDKKNFSLTLRTGSAIKGQFLLIKYRRNALLVSRFGFVMSLKVAGSVVVRNKIKRTLSEVVRRYLSNDSGGYDMVILVNKKEKAEALAQELKVLLDKLI